MIFTESVRTESKKRGNISHTYTPRYRAKDFDLKIFFRLVVMSKNRTRRSRFNKISNKIDKDFVLNIFPDKGVCPAYIYYFVFNFFITLYFAKYLREIFLTIIITYVSSNRHTSDTFVSKKTYESYSVRRL